MSYLQKLPHLTESYLRAMDREERQQAKMPAKTARRAAKSIARLAARIRHLRAQHEATTGEKILPEPPSMPLWSDLASSLANPAQD